MAHDVPAPLVPAVMPLLQAIPEFTVTGVMPMPGGGILHIRFPNGYGASIIRHFASYGNREGLFEVGVLGQDGELSYTTGITTDVEGWLTPEQVRDLCVRIAALPKPEEGVPE